MRIAAVEYLNTLPFLYGLSRVGEESDFDLILGHPARCAELLASGGVDIALCPIGALTEDVNFHLVTDYGIGCDGPVRTVSVYSHKPLRQLRQIQLYHASRTSNLLIQVLNHHYWQYDMTFRQDVDQNDQAGYLCIGDACFDMERRFAYRVDLGEAWKQCTGLPFLFAAWVAMRSVPAEVQSTLNAAFEAGTGSIAHMPIDRSYPGIDPRAYLRENISYTVDDAKRTSLSLFLKLVRELEKPTVYVAQSTSG